MSWQKVSGCNNCVKLDMMIGQWKQVIGDDLRSRIAECRVIEVNVAIEVFNRMLEFRCPPKFVSSSPRQIWIVACNCQFTHHAGDSLTNQAKEGMDA